MNVKEMVLKYLRENGYDGLLDDEDCGCQLDDLMPCGENCEFCMAGYKVPAPPESEWDYFIVKDKPE